MAAPPQLTQDQLQQFFNMHAQAAGQLKPGQNAPIDPKLAGMINSNSGLFGNMLRPLVLKQLPQTPGAIASGIVGGATAQNLGPVAQNVGGQVAQAGMTPAATPAAATPPAPGAVCPTCGQVMGGAAQTGQAAAAPPTTMPDAGNPQQSSYSPSGQSHAYDFSRS
jgi:hypothetical protein